MTDGELLDALDHHEWTLEFTGEMPRSWRVRTGYTARGPIYVYGRTPRHAISCALAVHEVGV